MLRTKFMYAAILLTAIFALKSACAASNIPALAADTCTEIPANAGDRVALVIGNSAYTGGIPALRNPGNDAAGVVRALSGLGFSIFALVDGTADTMRDCAARAKAATPRDGVALVYYSGHGIQIDDRNYMIATDAGSDGKLSDAYVYIDDVIDGAKEKAASVLVFLDACRNNPFAPEGAEGLSVSTGRGLQRAAATSNGGDDKARQQARGIFVAYSTSPNAVATDGTGGMSPFTEAFVQAIGKPGYSVQRALSEVSKSVGEATDWSQTPWIKSSLTAEILLNGGLTEDEAVTLSEKQAGESYRLLSTGDVPGAIEAALKGLPMPLPRDAPLRFGKAYNALVAATRSTSFRLGATEPDWYPAAYSPATRRAIGNGWGDVRVLSVWNTLNATKITDLATSGQNSTDFMASLSPDGKRVLAYIGDGKILLADAVTGTVLRTITIPGMGEGVQGRSLKFGPDGRMFVLELAEIREFKHPVISRFKLSRWHTYQSDLQIWDSENGEQVKNLPLEEVLAREPTAPPFGCSGTNANLDLSNTFLGFACSLNNNQLDGGGPMLLLFGKIDVKTGKLVSYGLLPNGGPSALSDFKFRADANRIVAQDYRDGAYTRVLLNTETGKVIGEPVVASMYSSSFSPDGSMFSAGEGNRVSFYSTDTGERVGGLDGVKGNFVYAGVFKQNGDWAGPVQGATDVWWVPPKDTDLVMVALKRLQEFGVAFMEVDGLAFKALD